MSVICLTKDQRLVDKIQSLYGDQTTVKVFEDYQLIDRASLGSCEVLVVDIKDCLLPSGNTFFSPIVALSELPSYNEGVAILRCGAKGYGNRHMRQSNLKQMFESVKAGQTWLPPEIIATLISKVEPESEKSDREQILEKLSKREQEVALMVAEGMSNQDIADNIFVSLRTVKAHLTSVYEKTGLRNRLELGVKLKQ